MDIRINMTPVIDYEEIENALNLKAEDFEFIQRADHSEGYFWLNTDEDAIPDLEENIQQEIDLANQCNWEVDEELILKLRNDIKLVSELRAMGLTNGVLIYIWY